MLPDRVQLFLGHLAVGDAHPRPGYHLADMGGAGLDVVHPVVQVVDLTAPGQLLLHGFGEDDVIVFQHERLHRLALDGRLLDGGEVADAAHGHVQGAGDGGGREGQHVHADKVLFQLLLVLDAETLLLVDDDKAQVVEPDVLGEQAVGADDDVHAAGLQAPQGLFLLFGGAEAGEQPDFHRERLHAGDDAVVVLPRQQGGGGQNGALLAAHDTLEGRAEGDLRLADAHVAAEQAVHGPALFHVLLDLGGGGELVVRLVVLEAGLEIALPLAVGGEGVACGLTAAGVELDELLGHLFGGLFDFGAGALPLGAAQLCKLHLFLVAGGGVAAQQIELSDRHIQHVGAGILDLQVIFYRTLHLETLDARIHADAVALVNHIVAGLDVREAGQGVFVLLALFVFGSLVVQTVTPGRDDRHAGEREGAARREVAGQYLNQTFRGPDVPAHADGIALVSQIAGKGRCTLGRAGEKGHGVPLLDQRVEVFPQGSEVAAPVGSCERLGVDEVFQLELVHAPQEVLAEQGALVLRRNGEVVHRLVEHIEAGADDALLEQAGQLFAAAELGGLLGVPDAAHLVEDEDGAAQVVQQCGGRLVPQTVVFVHSLGHDAAVQLGEVGLHGLFEGGAALAAGFLLGGAEGLRRVGGAAEQHLTGGGKIDLFQRTVPPLGQQVEGGEGVYLVVPVLHTGGLAHIGGVDVHDVAPDAELSRAVHLTSPHVSGGEEPFHQRLAVVDHAGLEGEGVFLEFVLRHSVLEQGFGGDADGVQPSARQCAQHRQTPVLVLAARAFDGAEHEVPGREHRRREPQRLEVVGEMGGLGLAGGDDAEDAARVLLERGVEQCPACRRQAEQRRRAGGGEAGRCLLIFRGVFQERFVHGGPPF